LSLGGAVAPGSELRLTARKKKKKKKKKKNKKKGEKREVLVGIVGTTTFLPGKRGYKRSGTATLSRI
jgi:hypothetical protein